MTDIQEWIDNSRAHADRAADHVADIAAGVDRWTMKVPPTDTDTDTMLIGLLDGTLGQALNALQAVMEIHKPFHADHYYVGMNGGSLHRFVRRCEGCEESGGIEGYPCPTVQAIQTELERKETQS